MSLLAKKILNEIEELNKPSEFNEYRKILKTSNKLPKISWIKLTKLLKSKKIYQILREKFTKKEAIIVGNCLYKIHLDDAESVISVILRKDDDSTPILLGYVLKKKTFVDLKDVISYIHKKLEQEVKLTHLQLLLDFCKSYPNFIDSKMISFCRKHDHGICKEILQDIKESKE